LKVKKIAEGSFGFVYLAKDMKPVAVAEPVPLTEKDDVVM